MPRQCSGCILKTLTLKKKKKKNNNRRQKGMKKYPAYIQVKQHPTYLCSLLTCRSMSIDSEIGVYLGSTKQGVNAIILLCNLQIRNPKAYTVKRQRKPEDSFPRRNNVLSFVEVKNVNTAAAKAGTLKRWSLQDSTRIGKTFLLKPFLQ